MAIKRINNNPDLWTHHPLGPPNRNTKAVYHFEGHTFALGNYNQFTDSRIISLTRHLTHGKHCLASNALAVLRRRLRQDFPRFKAIQTYTAPNVKGTSYTADGWVFVANHNGKKRWIRSL